MLSQAHTARNEEDAPGADGDGYDANVTYEWARVRQLPTSGEPQDCAGRTEHQVGDKACQTAPKSNVEHAAVDEADKDGEVDRRRDGGKQRLKHSQKVGCLLLNHSCMPPEANSN